MSGLRTRVQALSQRFEGSLTGRAALTTGANTLDYIVRVGVTFLLNPILVVGLGSYGFGLWQVLRQLIGYATPATGRPAQALRWTIANLQASQDFSLKRSQVGASLIVSAAFVPVLIVVAGVLAWFAPSWLEAPPEYVETTRWVALLLVVHLAITNFAEIPQQVLIGENQAYRHMAMRAAITVLGGVLMAAAVHWGFGLVGVAASQIVVAVLLFGFFIRVAFRYVPWFGVERPAGTAIRSFFELSGWFLASRLVSQLTRASDLVLLGVVDSVDTVTAYSLSRYLPEALISIIGLGVFGSIPGLGAIYGAGEYARAARLRGEIMTATWLVSTVAASVIVLWNRDFVALWIGPDLYTGDLETLLILVMSIQLAFIRNDSNFIDLTLELRQKVLLGGLSVAVSLGLAAWLLASGHGVSGLCLGFIAGRAILSVAQPRIIGRSLQIGFWGQVRASLRPLATTALLLGGALALAPRIETQSWLWLIAGAGASGVVALAAALGLGLSQEQRGPLRNRFGRILGRG